MAIDQQRLMQAVYDAIYDSLTTPPTRPGGGAIGNGQPVENVNTTFFSLAFPVGLPIDPTQFANAWSPINTQGSVYAAENFALLTDDIPAISSLYASTGRSIDGLYGQMLRSFAVNPTPVDPNAERAYLEAKNILFVNATGYGTDGRPITTPQDSPGYRNYKNKKNLLSAAQATYVANYLQYDFNNPTDQRRWSLLAPSLLAPLENALSDYEASEPGRFETALATVRQYEQNSLANIFNEAWRTYDLTRQGSVTNPNQFWHSCEAFPGNWFAEGAAENFTQMTIESRRVRVSTSSRYSSYSGGASASFGLWKVGGGSSGEFRSFEMSSETNNIKISFKFGRVEIRRPWFDPTLFSLAGWSVAGRRRGAYSSGSLNGNEGIFALLPTSFVVARDIQISGEWGSTDYSYAASSQTSGGSVGWGPFKLSGSYHRSSSASSYVSSFDGTTITVPGAQIIGWISQINPLSPPLDGGGIVNPLDVSSEDDLLHANKFNQFWTQSKPSSKINHPNASLFMSANK